MLREKAASLLGIFSARDNRRDATREGRHSIGLAVITLVCHRNARANVWADVERRLELCAVAGLAAGQMEVERIAVEIGLEVMVWTAPNGIDCARLRPLRLSDQG